MAGRRHPTDEERRREAERIIDRTTAETELLGTSSLARAARRAHSHMAAEDADKEDAIEVWGTRVARGLALVFVVVLLVVLGLTYL